MVTRAMVAEEIEFAWTDQMVGPRVCFYPPEEGNRVKAHSSRYWSRVETLPRERIEEIQVEKLRTLLRHVQESSPFYVERWRTAGVSEGDTRDLGDLQALPVVTKDDFELDQRASPPFGSACTAAPNEQLKLWQSSGTTGAPRLWVETREDWENGMYLYARSLFAHGVRPGWRAFSAFSYPPFIAFWLAHYAAEMMGCQVVPKGPLPTQVWLGMIQRLAGTTPSFMWATPTYMQRQLEVCGQLGMDPAALGLKLLSLAGEPGACVPATKAALEKAWGAKVHDILGSTETSGPILFTCEAQAELAQPSDHANADYFILEILDRETLKPLAEGEAGALCVTALGRTGIPAVRFLLNDYVRLTWEECACGRTLPLVKGGVSARTDDMLILKGVNVYPTLIENLARGLPGLSPEYMLIRQDGGAIVRVEALPEVSTADYAGLANRLQDALRAATSLTLPVEILAPGSIPRSETKSRRIQ